MFAKLREIIDTARWTFNELRPSTALRNGHAVEYIEMRCQQVGVTDVDDLIDRWMNKTAECDRERELLPPWVPCGTILTANGQSWMVTRNPHHDHD